MPKLGVNIDHVATLRQARQEGEPDVLQAVRLCEKAGADSIVCHLREDRRHIHDQDVRILREHLLKPLNLEMSIVPSIVKIACCVKPDQATLVPERRQELTTEGGLDVARLFPRVQQAVAKLQKSGITVSLFVDPVKKQIRAAKKSGATIVELHTGRYATATTQDRQKRELKKLRTAAAFAHNQGLAVAAGHGLKYHNTRPVARIKHIEELNIGHSIVAAALVHGLTRAVKNMKSLVKGKA